MDDNVKVIEIKSGVLNKNDRDAATLRKSLKDNGIFLLNLMSSPGSGKTTTLIQLINQLKGEFKIAVMEADIDSDVDAKTIIRETGVESIQLHTGGMCHLDAEMTAQGIDNLADKHYDLVVLENIGNLVCPAEYDTGAELNMTILSVPEGEDKPLKYPLMYSVCDAVVINKIDTLKVFDFDIERCTANVRSRNPKAAVFAISAKTGEGINTLASYIKNLIKEWRE